MGNKHRANYSNTNTKKNVIVKLKVVVEKLHRTLSLSRRLLQPAASSSFCDEAGDSDASSQLPGDVKEGHFAVVADDGAEEPRRFVLPLSCLTHPRFLRLLERAEEEYGFDRPEGALRVPCRPSDVERILADWDSCEDMKKE